ncbi:hypothetical protein [Arcticibacterium luteifluviistationis]|uniref:Uncharacterized protein n=1 Tax=Arcticibacterium luteifluviistationis TaxID=1784714 RepID=A0A2Z4GHB0_9BACT|nr:hypothetical protein [Arcticibacterium luteifluviistationis]AWW00582.1 hypothetical protein DJ013_21290 [Arcticibacterium luteifluviistationis]
MKFTFLLVLFSLNFSAFGQEKYFLIEGNELNEATYQKAIMSNNFLEIDIEKAELNGKLNNKSFKAFYDVLSTSIGFVKGFKYRLTLGYLQRDVVNEQRFINYTQALAEGQGFYFYPDVLASPSWHFLEISGGDNETLRFVRKH